LQYGFDKRVMDQKTKERMKSMKFAARSASSV
jgi:hypothetical protein